ncbi:MAG: hypothetical protein C4536_10325 [Actinobacteria bacterium]|jgi:cytochrome bd-type quinol oxidase subunit 1|nr:MAG: hypothetical protein C4536_10325 [Actinomycetota bacterium]
MDERLYTASRWLTALAIILVPLSVIAVVSGAWGLNYQFDTAQWTRYLLFASWILLALSVIAGIANLISPPEVTLEKPVAPARMEAAGETEGDEEETAKSAPQADKPPFNVGYAFLLAQACTLALGVVLYVAYISWMILGLQSYPALTGL